MSEALNFASKQRGMSAYFSNSGANSVIYDAEASKMSICPTRSGRYSFKSDTMPLRAGRKQFVYVTRIFADSDAAYVELSFYPRGTKGAFFLRKTSSWKVVGNQMWED